MRLSRLIVDEGVGALELFSSLVCQYAPAFEWIARVLIKSLRAIPLSTHNFLSERT